MLSPHPDEAETLGHKRGHVVFCRYHQQKAASRWLKRLGPTKGVTSTRCSSYHEQWRMRRKSKIQNIVVQFKHVSCPHLAHIIRTSALHTGDAQHPRSNMQRYDRGKGETALPRVAEAQKSPQDWRFDAHHRGTHQGPWEIRKDVGLPVCTWVYSVTSSAL